MFYDDYNKLTKREHFCCFTVNIWWSCWTAVMSRPQEERWRDVHHPTSRCRILLQKRNKQSSLDDYINSWYKTIFSFVPLYIQVDWMNAAQSCLSTRALLQFVVGSSSTDTRLFSYASPLKWKSWLWELCNKSELQVNTHTRGPC